MGKVTGICRSALLRVFVDSPVLYMLVRCHQKPERSFAIRNRQFHVCARCTGLVCGAPLSLIFLPLYAAAGALFPVAAAALLIDGLTQGAGLRESNNILRFGTGISASALLLPFILSIAF